MRVTNRRKQACSAASVGQTQQTGKTPGSVASAQGDSGSVGTSSGSSSGRVFSANQIRRASGSNGSMGPTSRTCVSAITRSARPCIRKACLTESALAAPQATWTTSDAPVTAYAPRRIGPTARDSTPRTACNCARSRRGSSRRGSWRCTAGARPARHRSTGRLNAWRRPARSRRGTPRSPGRPGLCERRDVESDGYREPCSCHSQCLHANLPARCLARHWARPARTGGLICDDRSDIDPGCDRRAREHFEL